MLDSTPTDWTTNSLRAVVKNVTTKWSDVGEEAKYIGLEHISQGSGRLEGFGSSKEVVSAKNTFRQGDVLFGKLRPNLKKFWLAEFDGICSTDILVLRPQRGLKSSFLSFLVQSTPFMGLAMADAVGTKMPRTSWNRLGDFVAALPPLPEQERIAEILASVDDSIRATEAVIAQADRVKRGLMEDLLTGGMGSEAIARGEVPEGWNVKPISDWQIDLVDGDRGKEYPKSKDFLDEGFCLFLNAKNVTKTGWQFDERKFIREERHLKLRKGTLERGDIVITTRGTIGNIAYYDDRVPFDVCRINSGMAIFRNRDPNILTPFLKVQLEAVPIQRQIETLTYGSAQPALTIKTLKSLSLPVPEENEQERIIAALLTADENLTTNQLMLAQLQTVKRGLMDDLLTGRVRTV